MKPSRYNLIIKRPGFAYWYNSLSGRFFRLTDSLSDKIICAINDNSLQSLPDSLVSKLNEGGFIVPDGLNELAIIRENNNKAILDKNYFLIILPTLNCNYHCWYCIQDHIESRMDNSTVEKIKRHIDHMVDVEKIESLRIDWFGGEPFLYFNEVVKPLSIYAKTKCESVGIPFINSSTTNGFYLSDSVTDECGALHFKHFQITLDGNMESHDKVKFQKGCESTFVHVLQNINNLLSKSDDIVIYLRINYTHKNISGDIVEQVNRYIDASNRDRISITPRKVWQESVDNGFSQTITNILDRFRESGYNVEYWNPVSNFIPCYANKKYYNAINYNGNVVKCTACNDLYDPNPKGYILDDGSIKWIDNFDGKYMEKSFENERCLECGKLPICMGLCPREHVGGSTYCKEDTFDTRFEDSIISLIDRCYKKETCIAG